MKKLISFAIILAMLPFAFAEAENPAETLMALFGAGDYAAAYDMCAPDMQAALGGAENMETVWAQLTGTFGEYVSVTLSDGTEQNGYTVYYADCEFAAATVRLTVTFDENGLLAGLFVDSYAPKGGEDEPAEGIIEEEILLRAGEADETRGMLTLPEGDGPFPCVIMMQGSGASDMDENAGGVKIFKLLARGLAARGVASVRYDKYTYAHTDLINAADFGIEDEYFIDLTSAYELASADSRIGNIFILGHSLGACVAPRACDYLGAEKISGCVMLAGSPISLFEILLRQLGDAGTDAAELDEMRAAYDSAIGQSAEERAGVMIYGASAAYWIDEAECDEAALILQYGMPVFIAQGEDDVQVTLAEGTEAWKAALGDYENAEYRTYAGMGHFLNAEDDASRVSDALTDDIAAWIFGQ